MCCVNSSARRFWGCRCSSISTDSPRIIREAIMNRTIWVGAVAYDPKVVTIWEGMRRYFHEEARLPVEVVLFQSYEAQVSALLAKTDDPAPRIDIAWNTNLAYLQADSWSGRLCRPI